MKSQFVTKAQAEFVADIEAGAAALKSQGIEPKKAAEIFEAGGRAPGELSYFAYRFAEIGAFDCLNRIIDAFASVGLPPPLAIRRALDQSQCSDAVPEPENIESETIEMVPAAEVPEPVFDQSWTHSESKEPEEIFAEVVRTIKQLPNIANRQKIAMMAANWFGV